MKIDVITTVKPVHNFPVYSSHPVYYGHRTMSQNFQLPYIFRKVDMYIAVTLYTTVTLPFPKGDRCTQVRGLRYTEVSYQKVGLELMATQRCWSELHVGCTTRSKHSTQMYITHYVTAIVVKRTILFCFFQV